MYAGYIVAAPYSILSTGILFTIFQYQYSQLMRLTLFPFDPFISTNVVYYSTKSLSI